MLYITLKNFVRKANCMDLPLPSPLISLQRWPCFQATVEEDFTTKQIQHHHSVRFFLPHTRGACVSTSSSSFIFRRCLYFKKSTHSGLAPPAPLPLSHFCFFRRGVQVPLSAGRCRRPRLGAPPQEKKNNKSRREARQAASPAAIIHGRQTRSFHRNRIRLQVQGFQFLPNVSTCLPVGVPEQEA